MSTSNTTSRFAWGTRTYIMAILNATPDSFSGDGVRANVVEEEATIVAACAKAEQAIQEGADILDIGGMSTRPGAPEVTADEELARVQPIIAALSRSLMPTVPLSIDTYRATVARAALEAGAVIVNSVRGIREESGGEGWNEKLAAVVAEHGAMLVLTHNGRSTVRAASPHYEDLIGVVREDLLRQADFAESRGIARDRLIADPGIGFGKSSEDNLRLLRHIGDLQLPGLPLLVGTSRKSFIGQVMGNIPPEERDPATAATTAWAIPRGADIARVHDVALNAAVARMTDALYRIPSETR